MYQQGISRAINAWVFDFSYARLRAILHEYRRNVTFAVEAIDKTVYVRVMQIRIL